MYLYKKISPGGKIYSIFIVEMEHVYKVKDYSVLSPWYTKYLADPVMQFVPWHLPANIITIFSNLCVFLAFLSTVLYKSGILKQWIFIPALIIVYASGDIIDGKQARRTMTSSRLGEFLDHFLDLYVNGMLLSALLIVFGIADPVLTALYFTISYLTVSSAYFEQHKTGVLVLEKIGSLEAIIIAAILLAAGFIERSAALLTADIIGNISLIDLLLAGMAGGAVLTIKKSLDRTGRTPDRSFITFIINTSAAALFSSLLFNSAMVMAVITLYCGSYIGLLQSSHLNGEKQPPVDYVFPLYLAACLIFNIPAAAVSAAALSYLSLCFFLSISRGFICFGKEWIWRNPDKETVDNYIDAYTL